MKRPFILLALMILPWITGAQQKTSIEYGTNKSTLTTINDWSSYTILFQETFDSARWYPSHNNDQIYPENMPDRWSVVDNTNNDFFWTWSQDYIRDRRYLQTYTPLNSTSDRLSGRKGTMMLESSYYNTEPTGDMTDPPIEMDSYIQFGPFEATESESVILYFEQYHRFCCGSYDESRGAFLEVSNNGEDWIAIPVHQASINSRPTSNPSIQYINISAIAANSETVYFRFHQIGLSHYYWVIDDIYVYEPYEHDTRLLNYWTDYTDYPATTEYYNKYIYTATPFHTPYFCFQPFIETNAKVVNCGKETVSNARLKSTITHNGNEITSQTSPYIASLESCTDDTLKITNTFQIPQEQSSIGNYTLHGVVETDEDDATIENNIDAYNFNITSELHGYANPNYVNSITLPYYYTWVPFIKNTGIGIINFLNTITSNTENDSLIIMGINVYFPETSLNNNAWNMHNPQIFGIEFHEGIIGEEGWEGDLDLPLFTRDSVEITPNLMNRWIFIPFSVEGDFCKIPTPTENIPFCSAIRTRVNDPICLGADPITPPSLFSNIYISSDISFTYRSCAAIQLVTRQENVEPTISNITFRVSNSNPNTSEGHPAAGAVITILSNDALLNPTETNYTANGNGEVTIGFDRNGSYSYKVDYLGAIAEGTITAIGRNETKEITFSLVGIENQTIENKINLYPNPSTKNITVESTSKIDYIQIYNLSGKMVKSVSIKERTATIKVSDLSPGVYLISITNKNGTTSKQFIKE